jgi:hypothetical protein
MVKKQILTQVDLDSIKEELKQDFPTKEDFQDFKSEFFDKIDPILKEVTTARGERTLLENRVEKLEDIHTSGKHALVSQ